MPALDPADVPALARVWEAALPDSVLGLSDDVPALDPADVPAINTQAVPALAASAGTAQDWRIEVTRRGKFWQWRKGRGRDRQSRYGGKFELLSDERKAAYHDNKRRQAQRRKAQATTALDAR